ncbi:3-methylornithyl-N6-L-lysine dehydrogenase PylD [Natroniella sulfidigena]|uniref:3-methylornithyl-N6-L-lysine dehydrogenase PylD n=1 Tax=Natroniella sulfidigena TaxID=723921 RepID=UPI00200B8F18|nr:3-methylornithyl-N6-L-lysine dehydrogenase PylD [Natroniella sulfidigena]
MTRLVTAQIKDIPTTMKDYDQQLQQITGCSLFELANYAVEASYQQQDLAAKKAAVIPVTAGEGLIEGFSEAVMAILEFIGFEALITDQPDLGGLDQAYQLGADIALMADDDTFLAWNLANRKWANNDRATAKGYVAALNKTSGGLTAKSVLVLGLGSVGVESVKALNEQGVSSIGVCDLNVEKMERIKKEFGPSIELIKDLTYGLQKYDLIIEATPAAEIIRADDVDQKTVIAAPGIPLGLSARAVTKIEQGLIHDPLQLGVAVMGLEVL